MSDALPIVHQNLRSQARRLVSGEASSRDFETCQSYSRNIWRGIRRCQPEIDRVEGDLNRRNDRVRICSPNYRSFIANHLILPGNNWRPKSSVPSRDAKVLVRVLTLGLSVPLAAFQRSWNLSSPGTPGLQFLGQAKLTLLRA